ncbi:MAG: hypothetical protein K9H41_11015 [Bacteroidia bacterium]|jgi:hypothetical protein|nr:hypothetical protein [Bacteroidia bacterium]
MWKLVTILILFNLQISSAQTKSTTYKNKSGNAVGHSKQNRNITTYYNKSGNKTGVSIATKNGNTIYYNKQGNKTVTSKTK